MHYKRVTHIFFPYRHRCVSLLVMLTIFILSAKEKRHTTSNFGIDTLTILTYNVENLFDLRDNGSEYDSFKPFTHGWNDFTCGVKRHNIASTIACIKPHIAVCSEIENAHAAALLQKELSYHTCSYPYVAIGDRPKRSATTVVIYSVFPIIREQAVATVRLGAYYSRNLLETDILIDKDTITLFAVHWPSKRHAEETRIACAQILKKRITQLPQNRTYLIAGDFNSDFNEFHTVKKKSTKMGDLRTAVNHVMHTIHPSQQGRAVFVKPERMNASPLLHFNPWTQYRGETGSYLYKNTWHTFDQFLLSKQLFDDEGWSFLDHSLRVHTCENRLLRNGRPYRWQYHWKEGKKKHLGKGFSDHLPVSIKLVRSPYTSFGDNAYRADRQETFMADFEKNLEGCIGSTHSVTIERTREQSCSGNYSLHLTGTGQSQNKTILKKRMRCGPKQCGQLDYLSFQIRGSGAFSIRMKWTDDNHWMYYNAPDFLSSGNARYQFWSKDSCTELSLPLPPNTGSSTAIDFEIRLQKRAPISLIIDNIFMQSRKD